MSTNFPIYGVPFVFYTALESKASPGAFQPAPTFAAGDVKLSLDGGAESNITTLPYADPSGSRHVRVELSATEMQADNISLIFSDQHGDEWFDMHIHIQPQRIPFATVDTGSLSPTTTIFDTDLTKTIDNFYSDLYVYFISGTNNGVSRKISAYDGTTTIGKITLATALPSTPGSGDKFLILGRSE